MKSPTISLEPTQFDDAEDLASLRVEAMRESLERVGRFDVTRARERFLSGFSPEHTRHITLDGSRVGFVVVKPEDGFAHLDHLYVHPHYQGRKIGSTVLVKIIDEANGAHLPVHVGALRGSSSNRFYLRHGFKLTEQSEFDNYYIRRVEPGGVKQ